MNDPNGLFRDTNGTYHIYYQYDATGIVAGNQHWGHATSKDLYHWENQQIALFPPKEMQYVFSGSAVIDTNNTSGFFPGQDNGVVAIYTLAAYDANGDAGPQTQNIAWSLDGGYTFEPYSGNPVINSTSSQFRDPKVIRYGDNWVMVISHAQDFVVEILTSPDLKNWTHGSNFSHHGLLGTQYECPNLTPIPARDSNGALVDHMWLMGISLQPGAPLGGSITQYFPGYFNGTHFTPVDGATRLTDFAKDNYAGQFFYGIGEDEDALSIAWASNWQYAQRVPTASEGWRSTMSLPRRNYITNATRVGWIMVNEPADLTPVLGAALNQSTWEGNGSAIVDYSSVSSNALYFEANVTGINATAFGPYPTFNMTFLSPVSGENLRTGFFFNGDTPFFLDRSGVNGFSNDVFWTDKFSTSDVYNGSSWSVSGVIDRSILEVFVDGGKYTGTMLFYPDQPLTMLRIGSSDLSAGTNVSIAVYALDSGWAEYEDEYGTVRGNVTELGASANATGKRHLVYEASF